MRNLSWLDEELWIESRTPYVPITLQGDYAYSAAGVILREHL